MSLRVVLKSRGYAQAGMGDSRMVAALVREFYGGGAMAQERDIASMTFADFPVDLLQEVKKLRREARAAGLAESEVEKISTCPLVKLLVRQK